MIHVVATEEAKKEYTIPVTWEVFSKIKVQANSLEEAYNWTNEHLDEIPLDYDDCNYVDGSYEISADDIDGCALYNIGVDDEEEEEVA